MEEGRFLKACRLREVDRTPVWLMRQAGRYLPEYREIRSKHSLLEICSTPELAAEVTLQPLKRFDLDAAIVFADILLPLEPLGVPFEFAKAEGPVVHKPVRSRKDVDALRPFDPESELSFVLETLRLVRRRLDPGKALIGFAGAPFTVASYMIEGGYSRNFVETKLMIQSFPKVWHDLMEKITRVTSDYLKAQVSAGAQAIQLFDSWVGCLSTRDYREAVLPYSTRVFRSLKGSGVPRVHFATGAGHLLELMQEAGGDVMGVDWRSGLGEARARLGQSVPLQGNLDPVSLLAAPEVLRERVLRVLQEADGMRGHVFNLGHGILPQTPPENVDMVVHLVHARTASAS